MEFTEMRNKLMEHFNEMVEGVDHLFEVAVDKDEMWELYLNSFPAGTNEIYRERRDHDCSCCRQFIKTIGSAVAIKNNRITTIWDFTTGNTTYQPVLDALSKFIKSHAVSDVYVSKFKKIGTLKNYEEIENGKIQEWTHFYVELPDRLVDRSSRSESDIKGNFRDTKNVFKRSLDEITTDSLDTILELINSNTLYKGEEWKNILDEFKRYKKEYDKYYGEKGVKVCERWHRFDFFFADMETIHGFDKELFNQGKLRLDKDILSIGFKIYSPQTTMWVSDLTNQKRRTAEYNNKNKKYEIIRRQSPKSAPFMYQNNTIQDARNCKENVENSVKHNTLAIGYIGIAEMCQALFGKNHAQDKEVHSFALSVVKRINEYAAEASERNNLNFSCYATPAEGLCRTALQSLRKQYGIIENVTSHEYLTNSHHVPVWEKVSIYEKLEIEAPFCKYPTGGCITYVELESTFVKNTEAVEQIIDYAFKDLDVPYLAFNYPIDSCLDCGYQDEFNDKCPQCGSSNIQQLRRVTGYLTTDYRNFNDGKQAEVRERVKHSF